MIEIKRVIFSLVCVLFLNVISVSALNNSEFMPYINSSSGLRQYVGKEDLHKLIVDVLNSHHNFQALTSLTPNATVTGALRMCDAKFIDDIMYKTFRIETPRPQPDQLMELGYYYNNGFYYYKTNTPSYSVKINEITKTITLDDGGVYVIFTDTLTTENTSPITENSAIKFYRDSSGWFITEIHMGLDFSNLSEHLKTPAPYETYIEFVWDILPLLVFIVTIIVVIVILYKFVLF